MSRRESEFLTEVGHWLTSQGVWYWKPPDLPRVDPVDRIRFRFLPKKPFDMMILNNDGVFIGIEAKTKTSGSLPFKDIYDHQIDNLIQITERHGVGFILVQYIHEVKNKKEKTKYLSNRAYLILVNDFVEYMKNAPRESLPEEWCIDNAYEIQRVQILNDEGVLVNGWELW